MDRLTYNKLREFGKTRTNYPLAKFTTFRIGGPAEVLIEVTEREKLKALLIFLSGEGLDYYVLGGGSNLLFGDDLIEKVVIRIKTSEVVFENDTIVADSGVSFASVAALALKNSLSGLEWSAGLPGTVGGAVRGNAGASGGDTSSGVEKVEAFIDGEILELSRAECAFSYRSSRFKTSGGVVLRAWFKLKQDDSKLIMQKSQEILKKRLGRHPQFPSAGSFFKNIPISQWSGEIPESFKANGIIPAGWFIEQAGLKGEKVGGAMVSMEHANFIINKDNARADDVLKLVEMVKTTVYNKFKIELEEEVQIVR